MRCAAYCTASHYNLHILFHLLKPRFTTVLSREYVMASSEDSLDQISVFFPYGVAVFWGWEEAEEHKLLQTIIPASPEILPQPEIDCYNFFYGDKLQIRRDRLILADTTLNTKLAISFGLAQSVKLTFFEETIYKTIEDSKKLPQDLSAKGKISMPRKAIAKKIGKLFLDKATVNLHSDILDEPDFFWEHPKTQPIYLDVLSCLDIDSRINVLNHRLTILGDVLEILNDQLNHQHTSSLEWTIIYLIMIEVFVALLKDVFNVF
ncbi:YagE family protein [Chlamydia pecorum MC/MarsBar]|uniref:RMD1 family protein n=1 Tax=Chlamydia pecorum TaxID=85991 RepID=UPI0003D3EC34|nr:RMD1 family protein [Chlamydia pecorum]ETF39982.1 YagE family protein [Chlamydia pecorum MC/MarsBar]UBV31990.1 YagE family protein [Chlamydia pecorum]